MENFEDFENFNEVVEMLKQVRGITFVVLGTGYSYYHDQSEFEIMIPPINSKIEHNQRSYTVESISIDSQDIIVRLSQDS